MLRRLRGNSVVNTLREVGPEERRRFGHGDTRSLTKDAGKLVDLGATPWTPLEMPRAIRSKGPVGGVHQFARREVRHGSLPRIFFKLPSA
jgi:hypothetical protein